MSWSTRPPAGSRRGTRRAAVALLVLVALLPASGAAFSDASANGASSLTASTGCNQPGPVTVTAVADAEVRSDSATTNIGTAATVTVRASNLANRRMLVSFTLPTAPSTWCSATAATLRLNASSATTGRTIEVYRAAASWTEAGVTWNNQPATTGTAATAASATGWVTWTVTSQVQAMYSGSNNGFVVRDQTESGILTSDQVYGAREGANDPELIVAWG